MFELKLVDADERHRNASLALARSMFTRFAGECTFTGCAIILNRVHILSNILGLSWAVHLQ